MRLRARILTLTLLGSSVPGQGDRIPPEKDTHGGGPSPLHTVVNNKSLEATATFCTFFQFGAYFPPTDQNNEQTLFLPPPSPQPLSIPPKELNSPRGDAIRHPPVSPPAKNQYDHCPLPLPTTTAEITTEIMAGPGDGDGSSGPAAMESGGGGGGGSDDSNDDDDDLSLLPGVGGALDQTMLADEVGETFMGAPHAVDEFNFASALGLRKNLAGAFDRQRHAPSGGGGGGGGSGVSSSSGSGGGRPVAGAGAVGGVRSRILQLEGRNRAVTLERSVSVPRSLAAAKTKAKAKDALPLFQRGPQPGDGTRPGTSAPRPGRAASVPRGMSSAAQPAAQPVASAARRFLRGGGARPPKGSASGGGERGGCALSVHLRLRPLAKGEGTTTIEVVPREGRGGGDALEAIRTHPPRSSNAAKVVRGGWGGGRPGSDLIFGGGQQPGGPEGSGSGSGRAGAGAAPGAREYRFNRVFGPEATQADVYRSVALPLVEGLFPPGGGAGTAAAAGQSALLFAYGITNAGKTHTMMGSGGSGRGASSAPVGPGSGIIPRALRDILDRAGAWAGPGGGRRYSVNLSYFEIYNEQCYDLLAQPVQRAAHGAHPGAQQRDGPPPPQPSWHGRAPPLKLRESRDGRIFVRGLERRRVEDLEGGMKLVREAMTRRHTSSNNINADSSRSHSVCQLEIVAEAGGGGPAAPPPIKSAASSSASGYSTEDEAASLWRKQGRTVSFWVVDLAGSERTKRTGMVTNSARQKEAAIINSSLMKLMRCLHTLRDRQRAVPSNSAIPAPFRESKLTHLFMNHLTGAASSRTSMIVNVNPSEVDYDETQHVLSYATIAKSIFISEDEGDRKRRAMAMGKTAHTHDGNGRSLSRSRGREGGTAAAAATRSPPKKIARLASKLSPKAMLKRRREQQIDGQKGKAAAKGGPVPSTSVAAASDAAGNLKTKFEKGGGVQVGSSRHRSKRRMNSSPSAITKSNNCAHPSCR